MLQQYSAIPFEQCEDAIRRAAALHGAQILAVSDLGNLLRELGLKSLHEARVYTVCFPELYAALLAADIRFSAFLPCRISAYSQSGGTALETVSPHEFARLLHATGLERLILPLETALRDILHEMAKAPGPQPEHRPTEDQMSWRGSIPQRIDCRGGKVEELGGVGKHDALGG
jgi:uncharacterized protein (DUF302 family)